MNYQSKTPNGDVITFTYADIITQSDFVWHLKSGEAVFPPRNYFVESVSKEMFAQMDVRGEQRILDASSAKLATLIFKADYTLARFDGVSHNRAVEIATNGYKTHYSYSEIKNRTIRELIDKSVKETDFEKLLEQK